ncbi:MAG: T9SS type A sorting domain-containing protein [Flavobacteriales bacterium]|nr:T9SS type A sorting domain-containing protein [Flavobacteriales bacterium]
MKKIFTFFIVFINALAIVAQTSINPPSASVEVAGSEFEGVGYLNFTNDGDETVNYGWVRNVVEITSGWTSAVCDNITCYFPNVSTSPEDVILAPGESSNLDVHAYPNGEEGSAIIEVIVTDQNNAENTVTGTYFFNISLSTSSVEKITNVLKLYPNPTSSAFSIENADLVERVQIFDVSGKLIKEIQGFGINLISVDDLKTGNYIVRMWDKKNTPLSSNILTIQ